MELSGMGAMYIDELRSRLYQGSAATAEQSDYTKKTEPFKTIQKTYMLDSSFTKKAEDMKNIKGLLQELKSAAIFSDKTSLEQYSLSFSYNNANISAKISSTAGFSKNTEFYVSVNKVPKSVVVSTDDMFTGGALGVSGHVEINGKEVFIREEDTLTDIKEKINNGEDMNMNGKLDSGEDVNGDGKMFSASEHDVTSFNYGGRLYIETKLKGAEALISLSGSAGGVAEFLGFLNEEGELKNIVSEAANGEAEINGVKYEIKNSKFETGGVEFDFSRALANESSRLTINKDTNRIEETLNEFKNKYNSVMRYLNNTIGVDLKNGDKDINAITYKLNANSNQVLGVRLLSEPAYAKVLETREGLGRVINDSLKSAGFIVNRDREIEFDVNRLRENIDTVKNAFSGEGKERIVAGIEKELSKYLGEPNMFDMKMDAANSMSKAAGSYDSLRNLDYLMRESRDIWQFMKKQLSEIDTT